MISVIDISSRILNFLTRILETLGIFLGQPVVVERGLLVIDLLK